MVEECVVRHRLQIPSRYSPRILLNPVVSQAPTCIAFPRGGNMMMSQFLVLASWNTRLAAGCLHCCRSSADLLSWLLSARPPHLQIVLGPLALSPTMVICFCLSAAHTYTHWLAKRLGSLWGNATIDLGAQVHHARQKPRTVTSSAWSRSSQPMTCIGGHYAIT